MPSHNDVIQAARDLSTRDEDGSSNNNNISGSSSGANDSSVDLKRQIRRKSVEDTAARVAEQNLKQAQLQALLLANDESSAAGLTSKDEISRLKAEYQRQQQADQYQSRFGSRSTSSTSIASMLPNNDMFKEFFVGHEDLHRPTTTTSFLKPGSMFVGSQQSGRSTYEVLVELKEVDLSKSELSGFLKIQGLTEDYPEIITFFKAEIVGKTYSFYTNHDSWGSSPKNDIQHWSRFPSWRALNVDLDNDLANHKLYQDCPNQEYVYMRWKETFLVPDAKVTNIRGASFAGFYYICFNQLTGSITGLYFHKSSERFQQLELSHVPDSGCYPVYEYQ